MTPSLKAHMTACYKNMWVHGSLGPLGYVYACRKRSGHGWTASSALHDTRTVNLALVPCECRTGKWTVIAKNKSIGIELL